MNDTIKTKPQFIRCANCEVNGIRRTIAELLPSGYITIQRRHNLPAFSQEDTTVIWGNDIYMACGACGAVVFTRKTENVRIEGSITRYFGTP
mgnify:CR=1 FL=1